MKKIEQTKITYPAHQCIYMTKVKDILPQTPKKKAVIWKKLIESASTSKVHSGRQGLTLTPACKKKLQVADAMVESVKEGIS